MLKKILVGFAAVTGVLVGIGLLLPGKIHVERSVEINAPAETVFPLIASFREFNRWSPWAKKDPNTTYTFSGPETGVGARMEWKSNDPNVGSGSQEITAVDPGKSQTVALSFGGMEMGKPSATYTLQPNGAKTVVTWTFDEDVGMNVIARYFGLMFDAMIGPDYENGLANLKAIAESTTAPPPVTAAPAPAAATAPATTTAPPPATSPIARLELAQKSGCLACHSVEKKLVGPAWKDVAARYKGKSDARAQLIAKVKQGGKGNWTEVTGGAAMPPYSPRVSDADIEALVDFVLAL